MKKERYLEKNIVEDLNSKMVFVGGPRQVGKTTLVQTIGQFYFDNYIYKNWDFKEDRLSILNNEVPLNKELILFDEIHKFDDWKNYLKGLYDKFNKDFKILATGSARLNLYRKGGDSLLGRYHYHVLHPYSVAEMSGNIIKDSVIGNELQFSTHNIADETDDILKFGGFPEPLFSGSERLWRRWLNERVERLIKEDIRDINQVEKITQLQMLSDLLPSKVGSVFSANSLAEDIGVSNKTINEWIKIFNQFYYTFTIQPFDSSPIKSSRRQPKVYLWDWSEINDLPRKEENFVASHLNKLKDYIFYIHGLKAKLYYLRNYEQQEVDFLMTIDSKPWFSVEVKTAKTVISNDQLHFAKKFDIPFNYQVIFEKGIDKEVNGIRVISFDKFLSALV